ncbi:1176_t:CDS:1, partial [Racocetra persica]
VDPVVSESVLNNAKFVKNEIFTETSLKPFEGDILRFDWFTIHAAKTITINSQDPAQMTN